MISVVVSKPYPVSEREARLRPMSPQKTAAATA
jgi:hypothetical protein